MKVMRGYQIVLGKINFIEDSTHISKTQIQISKCPMGVWCYIIAVYHRHKWLQISEFIHMGGVNEIPSFLPTNSQ